MSTSADRALSTEEETGLAEDTNLPPKSKVQQMLRGALLSEKDRKALLSSDLRINPFRHTSRDLVYKAEKAKGLRLSNGSKPLKKLTGFHMTAIALHLSGMTNNQIAALLGRSPNWVSRILCDPRAQKQIGNTVSILEQEFRALFSDVIEAVRDGLSKEQSIRDRLAAADKWLKANGKYNSKDDFEDKTTAEDVIQQIMAVQQNVSVSVSVDGNKSADGKCVVTLPSPGVANTASPVSHPPAHIAKEKTS